MRRCALRILALLTLGAIVNVAVAWGCCLYGYRDSVASVAKRHPPTGAELAWWRSVNPPEGVMEPTQIWPTQVTGYAECRHIGPGPFITLPDGQQGQITSTANWNEAGWPMRSLRGVWFGIPDPAKGVAWKRESRGAIEMPQGFPNWFPRRSACLPWWPKFPSFLVNTLFYAGLLWLLFAAPFALRRRRRIKRGLCPTCAYDLRATQSPVCPECGATR
jgi:hypothetical protein